MGLFNVKRRTAPLLSVKTSLSSAAAVEAEDWEDWDMARAKWTRAGRGTAVKVVDLRNARVCAVRGAKSIVNRQGWKTRMPLVGRDVKGSGIRPDDPGLGALTVGSGIGRGSLTVPLPYPPL
mgnify:CR=1 FL=1